MPSYTEVTKPAAPTETEVSRADMKNFLLAQDDDFLVFQDGSQIDIGGTNYEEVERPNLNPCLLKEDGFYLLLENGGRILISPDDTYLEVTRPNV